MIRIRPRSNHRFGLLNIMLILLVIFNSGYAGANAVSTTTIWMTQIVIIVICLYKLLILGILNNTILRPKVQALMIVVPSLILLLSGLVNGNLYTSIRPMLVWICAYLILSSYDYEEVLNGFQTALTIICIINLGVFIADILGITLPTTSLITNNGSVYKSGIVYFKLMYGNILSGRYMGCFWEPGLFASFLLLGIALIDPYGDKRSVILRLALYIFSIYTTKSAAGYVILPLSILFLHAKKNKENKASTLLLNSVILGVIIIAFIRMRDIVNALYLIDPAVFGKLINSDVSSNYARVNSYETNLRMFFERPIFGYGVGGADTRYLQLTSSSQTSTTTFWLAICGVFGAIPAILYIKGVLNLQKGYSIISKVLLIAIVFMIINKEPHLNNIGTTLLISAWSYYSFFEHPNSKDE